MVNSFLFACASLGFHSDSGHVILLADHKRAYVLYVGSRLLASTRRGSQSLLFEDDDVNDFVKKRNIQTSTANRSLLKSCLSFDFDSRLTASRKSKMHFFVISKLYRLTMVLHY